MVNRLLPSLLSLLAGVAPRAAEVLTITKLADTADGACDADCSLREAIIAANQARRPRPSSSGRASTC